MEENIIENIWYSNKVQRASISYFNMIRQHNILSFNEKIINNISKLTTIIIVIFKSDYLIYNIHIRVNTSGEVIAINTAKIPYAHGIGFAVQGGITL